MPILGIVASSRLSAVAVGDYESISTVTVGSSGQASVTFSSIPATFKHLQIRASVRSNRNTSNGDFLSIRFNGDSGANYSYGHQLFGNGASVGSYFNGASATSFYVERITSLSSTGNVFAGVVLDLLDYQSTTKNKTTRAIAGFDNNSASPEGQIHFASAAWFNNTTAVSSIEITSGTGNSFAQYSHFALYGIK